MISAITDEPLPPYAHRVDRPGGRWRRLLLHAALRATVRRQPPGGDIERLRRLQQRFDQRFGATGATVERRPVEIGGVAAEWLEVPGARRDRTIFYLHGGAFILRSPQLHAALVGRWCRQLQARALMVDYRLAPEHPLPAAPDDCLAAYRGLVEQGVAPTEIVFGGDSAGANLVLVTLQRARAAGLPMPRCAVLLSPVVDFTLSSRSLIANERRDPMFTLRALAALRLLYARPEQFLDPSASPLFGDFAGLPPLLFQAGEREMLLDESLRAAEKAHAAGVDVRMTVWRQMAHVFQALPLAQAAAAAEESVAFIRRHAGWND